MEKLVLSGDTIFLAISILLFIVMLFLIRKANNEMKLKNEKNIKTESVRKIENDSMIKLIIDQKVKNSQEKQTRKAFFNKYKIPEYIKVRFKKDFPKYFEINDISEDKKWN